MHTFPPSWPNEVPLGTAIYVYFILANTIADTTTLTECNFTLDGLPAGSFTHTPTTSTKLQYNALVFSQTGLTNANHTFMISTAGLDHEAFVNFDYAQYTYVCLVCMRPHTDVHLFLIQV